jgi:4-hydroxy-4-methyl-2-oxoglutarate aldolase
MVLACLSDPPTSTDEQRRPIARRSHLDRTAIDRLNHLTTPHLADSCLKTSVPIRCAPSALRPLVAGMCCAGRARPICHVGSIDVFFEALHRAAPGEVLVIDNGGRLDEACIGDIVALEAKEAGIAGIVIWGLHRDSRELSEIGFPVFSLGALPTGPRRLDARPADVFRRATIGPHSDHIERLRCRRRQRRPLPS